MTQINTPKTPPPGGTKLVVVSLLLALAAVVLTNLYIELIRRQVRQSSFTVYVLTRSILPGDRVKKQDVKAVAVPENFRDAFNDLGAIDEEGLNNRISNNEAVQRSAGRGELLTYAMFTAPGGQDLDRSVDVGRRMVSLPVNSRSLPGLLRPGMFVDIEAAFNDGGSIPSVLAVMERVRVEAVGTRAAGSDYDPRTGQSRPLGTFHTITIEVSPEEASYLAMIQRLAVGEFELYVRNPADQGTPKIEAGGINPVLIDMVNRARSVAPPPRR